MNRLTDLQTINDGEGKPAYVVVPYDLFVKHYTSGQGLIPDAVVSATVDGASPTKAWREHLRLTQAEVAGKLGVSQAAYAQTERAARPRKTTLLRIAGVFGISLAQLDF